MSWTDVFPILTDEQVYEFQHLATEAELEELDGWLGIARTVNSRKSGHVVAAGLFWKDARLSESEVPVPSREIMNEPFTPENGTPFHPWHRYVQPLLDSASQLRIDRPDIVFRVYLAADMEFLIEDLVEAGCEVCLMRSSSLAHSPGAMWRFLAFDEIADRAVTVTDWDRMAQVVHDVQRTEHALDAGLGGWRLPCVAGPNHNSDQPGFYRPISARHFGICKAIPTTLLMKAFLWHTRRGSMPGLCSPALGQDTATAQAIYGTEWPNPGFDEWFLLAAVYPRLAAHGVLTFTSWRTPPSHWFVLDIEYATWANPGSEVLHYGTLEFPKPAPRKKTSPESGILPLLLGEKERRQENIVPPVPDIPKEPLTLIVARYRENLEWILALEPEVKIFLYNKGPEITDPQILGRVDHLETLENRGKEADTYLYHLEAVPYPDMPGWTVFCQGDPFPHSPDFLEMLAHRNTWEDVQPLTNGYMEMWNVPPRTFKTLNDEQWMGHMPIYTEQFSIHTMEPLGWVDDGCTSIFNTYRQYHRIPKGWSIVGHFLESCGLTEMAEKAWRSSLGQFSYGAQFGVRNERLPLIPRSCIPRMREIGWEHDTAGYVYERLWLHLFGVPFTKPARVDIHGAPIIPREEVTA